MDPTIIEDRWYDDFYNTMMHQYILSSVLEARDTKNTTSTGLGAKGKVSMPMPPVKVYRWPKENRKSYTIPMGIYRMCSEISNAASTVGE